MNKKNNWNKRFSAFPVFMIILTAAVLFSAACTEPGDENKPAVNKVERSSEEIKDTSLEFSGNVAQATCLECHPAIKDGGFNIDFEKVKAAGMMRGKNMDVSKETKKTDTAEK